MELHSDLYTFKKLHYRMYYFVIYGQILLNMNKISHWF
jgi:hypothetical protein